MSQSQLFGRSSLGSFCLTLLLVVVVVVVAGGCNREEADETASLPDAGDEGAVHASTTAAAPGGGFTGVFHRTADGKRSVLNLTERGGKLSGMLDAANISGEVSGNRARGEVRDSGTAAKLGAVDLELSDDTVVMRLTAIDPQGGGNLQLPPVTYRRGAPPPINVQLDAQLTGRWRHMWAPGDSSATDSATVAAVMNAPADLWIILHPDGSIEHGRSSTTSDHAGITIDSSSDDGFSGKWRTSDRILHVVPAGNAQWFPFARYHVDGDKLTLTYNDGSRQVYYRQ